MEHASVKAYKGIGMEGWIAKWYAANTGKRLEDFRALARRVAGELAPGSAVLELAPGPGYFAIELAKLSSYRGYRPRYQQDFCRDRAPQRAGGEGGSGLSPGQCVPYPLCGRYV